jgi:2-keto-4-pentenoate hydratase/2-oxohepta-3-ene-1,7-dioic acid hydratase in catechol pathway
MRYQRIRQANVTYFVELDEEDQSVAAAERLEVLSARRGARGASNLIPLLDGEAARLLPASEPSKIVCVGLNYRRHAEELGKALPTEPLIFLKPSTAVIPNGAPIELPASSEEVHHEGELAVIIGRRARAVAADQAHQFILGYTTMNDVTARDIQRREGKYTRSKSFDTFAPLGPVVATDVEPDALTLTTRVKHEGGDWEVRQRSGCDDMIFKVPELIAFISSIMTLLPGDVISTGTPAGVGPIVDGDTVEVAISGVGRLVNPVVGPRR